MAFTPAAPFTPRASQPKPLHHFLPKLMKPAFERFGFASVELLTNWAAYAGADLASFTMPDKLKWPRRSSPEQAEEAGGAAGAVLFLRVSGARAIEVQHKTQQLIERINAAFGYRAVTNIRICQAPIEAPRKIRWASSQSGQRPPAPCVEPRPAGAPRHEARTYPCVGSHPEEPPHRGGLLKGGSNPRLERALASISAGIKSRNAAVQGVLRT